MVHEKVVAITVRRVAMRRIKRWATHTGKVLQKRRRTKEAQPQRTQRRSTEKTERRTPGQKDFMTDKKEKNTGW